MLLSVSRAQRRTAHWDKAIKNLHIATFSIFSITENPTTLNNFNKSCTGLSQYLTSLTLAEARQSSCRARTAERRHFCNQDSGRWRTQIPGDTNVFYYWLTNHVRNCLNSDTEINKQHILDPTTSVNSQSLYWQRPFYKFCRCIT